MTLRQLNCHYSFIGLLTESHNQRPAVSRTEQTAVYRLSARPSYKSTVCRHISKKIKTKDDLGSVQVAR